MGFELRKPAICCNTQSIRVQLRKFLVQLMRLVGLGSEKLPEMSLIQNDSALAEPSIKINLGVMMHDPFD